MLYILVCIIRIHIPYTYVILRITIKNLHCYEKKTLLRSHDLHFMKLY